MEGKSLDIYLYGMTVLSTIHVLKDAYPKADNYAEISKSFQIPGGETANAAFILSNLGYTTKIDGPFLGIKTKETISKFLKQYHIDYSGFLYKENFVGLEDLVLVDKQTRTVFGKFQQYFSSEKNWSPPDKKSIELAKIVSIDPFFAEESVQAARYCKQQNKKYIIIDCPFDSFLHKHSAANILSSEFIRNNYPNYDVYDLIQKYSNTSSGLVVFTFGEKEILFKRKDDPLKRLLPFKIEVNSTLGAGDTFRAGIIYGILNHFDDEKTVKFASATAALVCKNFPFILSPPSLQDILNLMNV